MSKFPRYKTIEGPIGPSTITLLEFGGDIGNSVAAQIKADGLPKVIVVDPRARSSWNNQDEAAFRQAVRAIACIHPDVSTPGVLSVLFDPPQSGQPDTYKRTDPPGEIIERDSCP